MVGARVGGCGSRVGWLLLLFGLTGMSSRTTMGAAIDLELRPSTQVVAQGDTLSVGLYAVADDALFSGAEVVFQWNADQLTFLGIDNTGAQPLLISALSPAPPDTFFGINEADPPQDGDAIYAAAANLTGLPTVTPAGLLLTTLRFRATAPTPFPGPPSAITILDNLTKPGKNTANTHVFGATPGQDVLGTTAPAVVTVVPAAAIPALSHAGLVFLAVALAIGGGVIGSRRGPVAVGVRAGR